MTPIPGYAYGDPDIPESPVTHDEFNRLKESLGFTEQDKKHLERAGVFLPAHAQELINHWTKTPGDIFLQTFATNGTLDQTYLERTKERIAQWIHDTCNRPYDDDWLNYQHEIGKRHHRTKKNQTDHANATDHIPLRYLITFIEPFSRIQPNLNQGDFHPDETQRIQTAWRKSLTLQVALWTHPYANGDW